MLPFPSVHTKTLNHNTLMLLHMYKVNQSQNMEYDIVVYGGTSSGIAAAIQTKRMGKRVVVIEPDSRIGGLTTGGLGQTDIGNKMVIGGIAIKLLRF